ncbi:MAG: TIR domain-containing protein, partial [Candidatus Tectomicrobia bacterium]|nr:TIR domain-containing protein [Candidatus Tectomicrobia bacterium]
MIPQEMFLSYSSLDQDFVIRVVNALRRHGVLAWHSQTNIMGAQQWHDEIGAALHRCDWFLVVLSP